MSSAVNSKKEKSKIFETVLSSPGMKENCKIVLTMSRQNILVLTRLIDAGLLSGKASFDDEILETLPAESANDFKVIHEEVLKKSGLTDFYNLLTQL